MRIILLLKTLFSSCFLTGYQPKDMYTYVTYEFPFPSVSAYKVFTSLIFDKEMKCSFLKQAWNKEKSESSTGIKPMAS